MRPAWLLFLLPLALAGCMQKQVQFGGIPAPLPKSVVSLSPSTTELVATKGGNQLTGRTASCNFPSYAVNAKIYAHVKPDYEALAADKPDLVVYDKTLYSDADIAKLKELGLNTFEFHADTLDEFISQLRDFGKVLNQPVNFSEYVDKIIAERDRAKAAAPAKAPTVATLEGTYIDGTKTFGADVIRNCGGNPVGPESDRFVPLNAESLVQMNPDIVLIAVDVSQWDKDREKQKAILEQAVAAFSADARFKNLKAVQAKHVYPINADVMLREGSRVDSLIPAIASVIQSVSGS